MINMEEVSSGIDAHIWRNMPNVLGAVRRGIGRIEHQVAESPEPSDSSISSGYSSVASSPADSPAPPFGLTPPPSMPITPDPEAFQDESPEPIDLRATPSPQLVPNAERRAESPQESTSEDRADVPVDSPPLDEEEGDLYEVLACYAERKSKETFELLNRYLPGLLNRRDKTGEAADSGEGQGEGSSSQEDPPKPEEAADSSSQGTETASTSSDGPTGSSDPLRSASRRAQHPTPTSQPSRLQPRDPRRRDNLSVPTTRTSSTSPPDHRARSSPAGSRSRSPREPIVPPTIPPARPSTAPNQRSSRRRAEQEHRAPTPSRFYEDAEDAEDNQVANYRKSGPLSVGPVQVPAIQLHNPEVNLTPSDGAEYPGSARRKDSEYETADEGSARSSVGDSARTMVARNECEDFLDQDEKSPDDDDESVFENARETQPSDEDSPTN